MNMDKYFSFCCTYMVGFGGSDIASTALAVFSTDREARSWLYLERSHGSLCVGRLGPARQVGLNGGDPNVWNRCVVQPGRPRSCIDSVDR